MGRNFIVVCLSLTVFQSSFAAPDDADSQLPVRISAGMFTTIPIAQRAATVTGCDRKHKPHACTRNVDDYWKAIHKDGPFLKSDLAQIGKDPKSLQFLTNLNKRLDSKEKFNLWDYTLNSAYANGDKKKAIQMLGAVFHNNQKYDSSAVLSPEHEKIKNELNEKIYIAVRKDQIDGYPKGVDHNQQGIYHFYSNALFAQKMVEMGAPNRCAVAITFTVAEAYTRSTYALAQLNGGKGKPDGNLYSAYAGTQFAVSADTTEFTGMYYQRFRDNYGLQGAKAVGESYHAGLGGKESFCTDSVDWSNPPAGQTVARSQALR